MKIWGMVKRHKVITSILFTVVMITAVLGVQIVPASHVPKSSISIGQIGQKYNITIGSGVDASMSADYTATGTAAQQTNTFQIAMNALPTTGGILTVLSGSYTLNATITRAIPNVTIDGIGNSTIFSDNGSTPIFTAGSTGWNIQNVVLDAGGISGTWTGSNVTIGSTYYSVYGGLSAPTGRTASYVIAASDAPSIWLSQAGKVLTAGQDLGAVINTAISAGVRDIKLSPTPTYFSLSTQVNLPTDYLYIDGCGKDITTIKLTANIAKAFNAATYTYGGMSNLTLDGDSSNRSMGIAVSGRPYHYLFNSVNFQNWKDIAINFTGDFDSESQITQCHFSGNTQALESDYLSPVSGVTVDHCLFDLNGCDYLGRAQWWTFTNNVFSRATANFSLVIMQDSAHIKINNNRFQNTKYGLIQLACSASYMYVVAITDNIIEECVTVGYGSQPFVQVTKTSGSCKHLDISGNLFSPAAPWNHFTSFLDGTGLDDVIISGNDVTDAVFSTTVVVQDATTYRSFGNLGIADLTTP